jgi:uncharacterized membrane protein
VIDGNTLAILIVGLVVVAAIGAPIYMLTRARVAQAQADTENRQRYRELAEQSAAGQQQVAAELARLTERVAAIEKLLRDVG